MIRLIPGQNCVLLPSKMAIKFTANYPSDFSAFVLHDNGKIATDGDFIFYGNQSFARGTIDLRMTAKAAIFSIDTKAIPHDVRRIVFAITGDWKNIASVKTLSFDIAQNGELTATGQLPTEGMDEKALIIGEIYRYKNDWKYRFIAQGYKGGLRPLAESFGVEISDDEPQAFGKQSSTGSKIIKQAPEPPISATEKVNLQKINLTKEQPRVSLRKTKIQQPVYKINLNWNPLPEKKVGFLDFLFNNDGSVDLDLAAYVRLRNGEQTIIQALNKDFGDFDHPPYVRLLGDDRTGEQADGEWLEINGKYINRIDEIVIFTFIYEGVANWKQADGKVTIYIDGHPEINTALTEGDDELGLCAIARIWNEGDKLYVERINKYFPGHQELDDEFGWGFTYTEGTK